MALQLRPNCEYCDKDLPPSAAEARICSYECTFCAECGTHVVTRPNRPIAVIKVGTLDEPGQIKPQVAIYTIDKQPFHHVPEGMPAFERLPQR